MGSPSGLVPLGRDRGGLQHYVEALATEFEMGKGLGEKALFSGTDELFHCKILPVPLSGFVCLQQFICSFLFKLTSPHADSFLLLYFLLRFLFP